jgi:hypothetical protein
MRSGRRRLWNRLWNRLRWVRPLGECDSALKKSTEGEGGVSHVFLRLVLLRMFGQCACHRHPRPGVVSNVPHPACPSTLLLSSPSSRLASRGARARDASRFRRPSTCQTRPRRCRSQGAQQRRFCCPRELDLTNITASTTERNQCQFGDVRRFDGLGRRVVRAS